MSDPIGFLSVRRHPEHGYFGGYLIVNALARPLEFHCTMPVRPTRAQQLLYGHTLDDFLCGEQIAVAMYHKAKLKPTWVFTDCHAALAGEAALANTRFVYLDTSSELAESAGVLASPGGRLPMRPLRVGQHKLHVLADSPATPEDLEACLAGLAKYFELTEPFQRVLDALREAHPVTRAA
ncbi:MAG: hypothetical protein KatS3mg111_4075 [Pirellulaceae bacterium]|nr:MAG: hypothetical protein KatS3mg111_4075 [Pirellulaceae bacterium]